MDGPALPQEIFDLVIDEIAVHKSRNPDGRKALYQCSLVSRNFHARAIHKIFHKIRVATWTSYSSDPNGPKLRWGRLVQILTRNPAIAPVVRELIIETRSRSAQESAWFLTDPSLPRVIRSFHNLTGLVLHELKSTGLHWDVLPEELAATLTSCLMSPTLHDLEVNNFIRFPVHILFQSPSLKSLALDSVVPSGENRSAITSSNPQHTIPLRLHVFNPVSAEPAVRFLLSTRKEVFSELQELATGLYSSADAFQIWEIMTLASSTLRKFQLCDVHCDEAFTNEPRFDIGRIPSLREIQLSFYILPMEHGFPTALHHLLRLYNLPSNLEVLRVYIEWRGIRLGQQNLLLHAAQGWAFLDEILSDEKYQVLRLVRLELEVSIADLGTVSVSEIDQGLRPLLDGLLPRVRGSSTVNLDPFLASYAEYQSMCLGFRSEERKDQTSVFLMRIQKICYISPASLI